MTEAQVRKSGLKDGQFVLEGQKEQIRVKRKEERGGRRPTPPPSGPAYPSPPSSRSCKVSLSISSNNAFTFRIFAIGTLLPGFNILLIITAHSPICCWTSAIFPLV